MKPLAFLIIGIILGWIIRGLIEAFNKSKKK